MADELKVGAEIEIAHPFIREIIKAAEEALAFARGEEPAARLTVNGHAYVPENTYGLGLATMAGLTAAIAANPTLRSICSDGNSNVQAVARDIMLSVVDYINTLE